MKKRMPGPVLMAVFGYGFVIALQVLRMVWPGGSAGESMSGSLVELVVAIVMITALARGNRLGWQWGRYVSALGLIFGLMSLNAAIMAHDATSEVVSVVVIVPYATILFALTRRGSMEYFRLICPQCQTPSRKAANFMFTKAKCKKCGQVW